jgi:DNA primase
MPLFSFVKNNIPILDVVREYVKLRQAGNYWKSPCPFHGEKEASFTVSPDKQIFYCFGCHAGGDVISFIAKKENLSQIEAVTYLIDRYQLHVPEEIQKKSSRNALTKTSNRKNYFDLCQLVATWAHKQLAEDKAAKEYLKERNILVKTAHYFKIGYFAGGVRNMKNFLKYMADKGVLAKDLIEAGFLMEGRNTLYSPFEQRLLFPIQDVMGRCCGFGGRVFKKGDKRAKYYNSKEADWFSKGKLLFGLDVAKKEMQEKKSAYLVEGYTDCVAMVQHGYINTVATLGTACTQDHLKILSRYIDTLYVLYDGDAAGQKAILRLTQFCWHVNLELQIVSLPHDEDPASFLGKNGDLKSRILRSVDIFTFFVASVGKDFSKSSLAEKLALSEKIVHVIANVGDSFKKDILLQRACLVMQVPLSSLKDLMWKRRNKVDLKQSSAAVASDELGDKRVIVPLLEERIFSVIINSVGTDDEICYVEKDLIPHFSEYMQHLLCKFNDFFTKKSIKSRKFSDFLDNLEKTDKHWVIQCSLKFSSDASKELFEQLIFHFCKQNWKNIIQDIKMKMAHAKKQNDTQKIKELFVLFSKLKKGMQTRGLI